MTRYERWKNKKPPLISTDLPERVKMREAMAKAHSIPEVPEGDDTPKQGSIGAGMGSIPTGRANKGEAGVIEGSSVAARAS